ncbi:MULTISPECIES: hypothetical protein [Streptomyces]|uniref:Uncharacterized protein n=1 Tax=Streptomyces mirabilis TaxID=68239 RepID=A0ABU3V7C7_9ACTN|nr:MULTISPECIES: hypothetical protein [Streptomyces]MCX4419414.1 hypothetical protein [Streptomyces mirabilis]MCX4617571.1 hypothetical protein [Streptomyces mirabilis]MCX5356954.1 hypothetical protein [Streptomyces mirabilis]MDU9002070.1 hypothetical protein [Streptomyces mirabilis]QDO05185.1 hypothetical protein FNV68_01180 [Streptomyces sp. S1D4-23]
MFTEADNCTEDASVIAAKFDKYMRHFRRKVKDTDAQEKPMWRTRWRAPAPVGRRDAPAGPPRLPPGRQADRAEADGAVAELTREHWQGQWAEGGFRIYNGKMPIVATTQGAAARARPGRPRVLALRP